MEYIEPLTLITKVESIDDIGNVVQTESLTEVYARKNAVGTKEFYNATAVGVTPTAELQIRAINYNGQTEVVYKDIRYSVIRTIPKGKFDVVLVIGVKSGVN